MNISFTRNRENDIDEEIKKARTALDRHNEEMKLLKQTQNEFEEYKKKIDELSKQIEKDEKQVIKNRLETGSELYQIYKEKKNSTMKINCIEFLL